MKVFEHEHPLKLIDFQFIDEDAEDQSNEEKILAVQDEFVCTCKLCGQQINEYYRYYYKCIHHACDYHLHKFCAELPTTLKHTLHSHPLTLYRVHFRWICSGCGKIPHPQEIGYWCSDSCFFKIDVKCVVKEDLSKIYHPSHPHPLVSLFSKPILGECNACGKKHQGVFFQCTTCLDFAIHTDCAFLPKCLLIQQTTNENFSHTHPLTLSYSFPYLEKIAKYNPYCRVCGCIFNEANLWIYKCEKCIYYTHVDCATSRREPFMSILSVGKGKSVKNFKDTDYSDLIHLPFPDQTYSIPKQLFFKQSGPDTYETGEVSQQHIKHQHDLIFVHGQYLDSLGSTSSNIDSLIICHNPMKKIELLCNGCVRPIMDIPFYKCGANEEKSCNFALHEWCTRLPTIVNNHLGHPQHTLVLMSKVPGLMFNIFNCQICFLRCNGYAYGCIKCEYYVDVCCAFMPEKIAHISHKNHLLSRVKDVPSEYRCLICRLPFSVLCESPIFRPPGFSLPFDDSYSDYKFNDWCGFSCNTCDVYIHPWCALLLPETIRHSYDKHPMRLSYLPIENHKSEYFCEICENELNPHIGFYHCVECEQSMHSTCAPLILCCEPETYSYDESNIFRFLNVKFGSIHKTNSHPHPLSLAQGIEVDGEGNVCSGRLRYEIILKCHECQFAIRYQCCERSHEGEHTHKGERTHEGFDSKCEIM